MVAYFESGTRGKGKMLIDFKVAAFNEGAYSFNTPNQKWIGHLDFKALGKSKNLFLFFTSTETNQRYKFSVTARGKYSPSEHYLNFYKEPIGQTFQLETPINRKGFPKLLRAKLLK